MTATGFERLTPEVRAALERGQLVEITTRGRRTGQSRRIGLALHTVDGRLVISGHPGFPRGWIANLRADPRLTLHLKGRVTADLPARARVVTDPAERERLMAPIARLWGIDLGVMIASSPLIEVVIEG